jgi:hypothetical protein
VKPRVSRKDNDMGAIKNISGQKFGLLTAERFACVRNKHTYWICKCDCGNTKEVRSNDLQSGNTQSCGCVNYKHGKSLTTEYNSWSLLKDRCFNRNCPAFDRYGARGITVCERWRDSFENFFADMGPKPSPEHSIDRINNNEGYSPENCRWATDTEQVRNRGILKRNTSGYAGVSFHKRDKKWVSMITVNYKRIWIGSFDTLNNAIASRWVAEAIYWN